MSFPLYTMLMTNIPKKDLTIPQKNDFISKIKTLDQEGYEHVYTLIKCYFANHIEDVNNVSIPYSGKVHSDRIDFNLLDLPNELRQLLYKFILTHVAKMKEEKDRETTKELVEKTYKESSTSQEEQEE